MQLLSLLCSTALVGATSLPCYIILRLYPTFLDFNYATNRTTFISLFLIMIFIGSTIAFLFNDILIGSCFTIIGALVIECLGLVIIMLKVNSSEIILYYSLIFVGIPIGILQTCVAAFFGDQTIEYKFCFSYFNNFHFYLLGHFGAYIISIYLSPTCYIPENYSICCSKVCEGRLPILIAIVCILATIPILFFYWRSLTRYFSLSRMHLVPATLNRMKIALLIWLPFLCFWILLNSIEHLWINQSQNMNTKHLQEYHLQMIRAIVIILCIPILSFVRLRGDEFFRITIGGILIIVAVIISSILGGFQSEILYGKIEPNYTTFYLCNIAYKETHNWNNIIDGPKIDLYLPKHQVFGPFRAKTETIQQQFKVPITNSILFLFQSYSKIKLHVERNQRSLSSLCFIRLMSDGYTNLTDIYSLDPPIHIKTRLNESNVMEIPEGEYNITVGKRSNKHYFRSGGYYSIFFEAAYYHNYSRVSSAIVRIGGYKLNVFYQSCQYILLSLGKVLILSAGLQISYVLAEKDMKCSIIGIFWGFYYLGQFFYHATYNRFHFHILTNATAIYQFMIATILLFYVLYYFLAYILTDIQATLSPVDEESGDKSEDIPVTTTKKSKKS